MKIRDYHFNNHVHMDAGAFQVFYRVPLALDSGVYRTYFSDHDRAYHKRSIAHNVMLVCDPGEKFTTANDVNDCGQRWPANRTEPRDLNALLKNGYAVARVLGRAWGPDAGRPEYSYLEGDIAKAYSSKVRAYTRAFVFLNHESEDNPASLVVLDRIESADAVFRKTWLLHSVDEPEVNEDVTVIRKGGAKLVNRTLLPGSGELHMEKIGGPGREFEVAGENHPPETPRPTDEPGAWRVEISPAQSSAADTFLNVLQVMEDAASPRPVERLESEAVTGARIGDRIVLFNRNAERRRDALALPPTEGGRCLVTGLGAGEWQAVQDGTVIATAAVTEDGGTMYFEMPAGRIDLQPKP
jgi:hypothetical protein